MVHRNVNYIPVYEEKEAGLGNANWIQLGFLCLEAYGGST
jgi:hypothetical protein